SAAPRHRLALTGRVLFAPKSVTPDRSRGQGEPRILESPLRFQARLDGVAQAERLDVRNDQPLGTGGACKPSMVGHMTKHLGRQLRKLHGGGGASRGPEGAFEP